MHRLALPLALCLALPALADTQLSLTEFESYATGKTLTYALGGSVYGTEQYLPGRRVLWAFTADECRRGTYHAQGDEICFVYEDDMTPQCWTFHLGDGGLRARFTADPEGSELAAVDETDDPLPCPGPDVGV